EMLVDDLEHVEHAPTQELDDRGIACLSNAHEKTQRGVVARELVVVEEHPTQDFVALLFIAAAESAAALGEIGEDCAALCHASAVEFEHRDFAELVNFGAPAFVARFAADHVHEDRLPRIAAHLEHQRDFEAVAGLSHAIQTIRAHPQLLRHWQRMLSASAIAVNRAQLVALSCERRSDAMRVDAGGLRPGVERYRFKMNSRSMTLPTGNPYSLTFLNP